MEIEDEDFTGWLRDTVDNKPRARLYKRGRLIATLAAERNKRIAITVHEFKLWSSQTTEREIITEIRVELRTWYGALQLLLASQPLQPAADDGVQVMYRLRAATDLPMDMQDELNRVLGPSALVFAGLRKDWQRVWQTWTSRGLDVEVIREVPTGIALYGDS